MRRERCFKEPAEEKQKNPNSCTFRLCIKQAALARSASCSKLTLFMRGKRITKVTRHQHDKFHHEIELLCCVKAGRGSTIFMYFITMVLQQQSKKEKKAEGRTQTKAKLTKLPEKSACLFKGLNVHF